MPVAGEKNGWIVFGAIKQPFRENPGFDGQINRTPIAGPAQSDSNAYSPTSSGDRPFLIPSMGIFHN